MSHFRAMASKRIRQYPHPAVPLYDLCQLLLPAESLRLAHYGDTAILVVLNTCLSCLCLTQMTVSLRSQNGPHDSQSEPARNVQRPESLGIQKIYTMKGESWKPMRRRIIASSLPNRAKKVIKLWCKLCGVVFLLIPIRPQS